MKFFLIGLAVLLTVSANATTKMSDDAKEMFQLMSNGAVQNCLNDADVDIIVSDISKDVFRCPGCVNYTISGNRRNIDTPSVEKTIIRIKGRSVPGTVGGWIQTYACDVEN